MDRFLAGVPSTSPDWLYPRPAARLRSRARTPQGRDPHVRFSARRERAARPLMRAPGSSRADRRAGALVALSGQRPGERPVAARSLCCRPRCLRCLRRLGSAWSALFGMAGAVVGAARLCPRHLPGDLGAPLRDPLVRLWNDDAADRLLFALRPTSTPLSCPGRSSRSPSPSRSRGSSASRSCAIRPGSSCGRRSSRFGRRRGCSRVARRG